MPRTIISDGLARWLFFKHSRITHNAEIEADLTSISRHCIPVRTILNRQSIPSSISSFMGRRLQVVEYMAMIRVCSSALNILEIFICMILQFSDAISKQPLRKVFFVYIDLVRLSRV